jgi:glucan phosphorylase
LWLFLVLLKFRLAHAGQQSAELHALCGFCLKDSIGNLNETHAKVFMVRVVIKHEGFEWAQALLI